MRDDESDNYNRSMTDKLNNIAAAAGRISLPPGTSLQQVTNLSGKWTPVSCKVFTVRCQSTPRILGTLTHEDRGRRVWEYPVVTLPGFGRTDAKFAVLTAVTRVK